MPDSSIPQTPLPIIAQISRVVTRVIDHLTGDRVDYPLMVAAACVKALECHGIEARVMYGQAAWIEVLEDQSLIWSGCWGEHVYFWVATQFGEVVDLNTSVAYRRPPHAQPLLKSAFSPPILWSTEVPNFYKYLPEGLAELELMDPKDQKKFDQVLQEVAQKCVKLPTLAPPESELDFPNEAILCPGRKLLDDSRQTFLHFDRALAIQGLPKSPI